MTDEERRGRALEFFQQAYEHQMDGRLSEAILWYRRSIELYPTSEAYTFLGWAYSALGRYDDAIRECLNAIAVDPDFGNPYNDIGAYLIELGRIDDAIPWLEKAAVAKRYHSRCFALYNLGRVYERKGLWVDALRAYRHALDANPEYAPARSALGQLRELCN